jgi:uncharacterized protein (DUF433 family)
MNPAGNSGIEKTPGVCGGRARIRNTRIPVWLLVFYRKTGATDERQIEYYPHLTSTELEAAWDYYQHNANEVEQAIWYNDAAGNVPERTPPPAWVIVSGLQLGIPEDEICDAFDPPLSPRAVSDAWAEYWRNRADVERDIARSRQAG